MTNDQIDCVLVALDSIAERYDRECGLPTWKPEAMEEMRVIIRDVLQQEREACARLAETVPLESFCSLPSMAMLAQAIRARTNLSPEEILRRLHVQDSTRVHGPRG